MTRDLSKEFLVPFSVASFADMEGPMQDWAMLRDEYGIPEPIQYGKRHVVFPATARRQVLERIWECGTARMGGDAERDGRRALRWVESETCTCEPATARGGRLRFHDPSCGFAQFTARYR
jgi:hypothetical protein